MSLSDQINTEIKEAMKAKDKVSLESLRAIKSALLLAATEKGGGDSSEQAELKMLQKLVKQRKDAAEIFHKEGRAELAEAEEAQIAVIQKFLPEQMSEDKIREEVSRIITEVGAESMKDMGRVMGAANQAMSGQADSSLIAKIVKESLG